MTWDVNLDKAHMRFAIVAREEGVVSAVSARNSLSFAPVDVAQTSHLKLANFEKERYSSWSPKIKRIVSVLDSRPSSGGAARRTSRATRARRLTFFSSWRLC
jgi:hypothetical protein